MKETDSIGLQLTARFALQPNAFGMCGNPKDLEVLRRCAAKGDGLPETRETLSSNGFPHLNAFLKAIAQISNQDPFSDEVVKSYWLGNDLTDITFSEGRNILIDQYRLIIPPFDQVLEKVLPQNIFLTHLSQVVWIAAHDYPQPERNLIINQCMIAGARVITVNPDHTATVCRETLEEINGTKKYHVVTVNKRVQWDPDLTPILKPDESVAVHLGHITGLLTENEAANLTKWTDKVARLI